MTYIHILDEFSLAGGGVRSVVTDVSLEMAKRGLRVYICPLAIPSDCDAENLIKWSKTHNISFELLANRGFAYVKAIIKLRTLLKKIHNEDECCLFLHLKRGVLIGILSSLFLKNIRRIEVFHSNYKNYKLQANLCHFFIDHYLPVSKESKQQLEEEYGIPSTKITLAYNGVDIEKLQGLVSNIKLDTSIFRILSIGRMSVQKNLETAIAAYCLFKEDNILTKSEYIIAGNIPQKDEYEKIAKGRVKYTGIIARSLVCSYINSSDVVLFPSLWEGHSIALLEVLSIGCPVVVTDIPAFREVLNNEPLKENELFRPEPFGAVFHKGNIVSCKAAICYMAQHRDSYNAMKKYVLSLANNYTVTKQVDVYIGTANSTMKL